MGNFLNRIFRLQAGEAGLVFALGFALLGNSLARQISSIMALSGFLDAEGVNGMLLVLGIDYALVMLISAVQSLFVDRYNRLQLIGYLMLAFALAFGLLRIMFLIGAPGWLNYSLMYLISEQQFVLFPLVFWVLANDVFNFAQAKRLFPLISSWSFVGKLIGIGIAGLSPLLLASLKLRSEEVLLLNSALYLLMFVMLRAGLRGVTWRPTGQHTETARETLTEGWDFVREVPSFRYLTIAILALAVTDTIIEFRFWVVTDAAFTSQAAYQQFYSAYRLVATLISFGIQVFVTGRLLNSLDLKRTFYFFPLIALTGASGMLAFPGLALAVSSMLLVKLTRETVDESARKSFQALVPEERRGRVSTFMDSYLQSAGTIMACLLTGAMVLIVESLHLHTHLIYLSFAALAAAVAIWAVNRMGKYYEVSLLNWRLKRRQRATSDLLDQLD